HRDQLADHLCRRRGDRAARLLPRRCSSGGPNRRMIRHPRSGHRLSAKPLMKYLNLGMLGAISLAMAPALDAQLERSSLDAPQEPTLAFNQQMLEGWHSSPSQLDLEEPADLFFHIFQRLPDEVVVYPGEN